MAENSKELELRRPAFFQVLKASFYNSVLYLWYSVTRSGTCFKKFQVSIFTNLKRGKEIDFKLEQNKKIKLIINESENGAATFWRIIENISLSLS